uniref:Uncharacterized protein n=1 Tax=Ditylenchus dipsaci TaxID=166011 RepID=A0A915DGK6_9BILA
MKPHTNHFVRPCFLFLLLLLSTAVQAQQVKEVEIDTNEQQDQQTNSSWPPKPPFDFMAPNGTIPSNQGPWTSFKGWVGQVKQNTAHIFGKAGNDIETLASSASKVIQNKTQELGQTIERHVGHQNHTFQNGTKILEALGGGLANLTGTSLRDVAPEESKAVEQEPEKKNKLLINILYSTKNDKKTLFAT